MKDHQEQIIHDNRSIFHTYPPKDLLNLLMIDFELAHKNFHDLMIHIQESHMISSCFMMEAHFGHLGMIRVIFIIAQVDSNFTSSMSQVSKDEVPVYSKHFFSFDPYTISNQLTMIHFISIFHHVQELNDSVLIVLQVIHQYLKSMRKMIRTLLHHHFSLSLCSLPLLELRFEWLLSLHCLSRYLMLMPSCSEEYLID